jgi:RHS repeat-associated protein
MRALASPSTMAQGNYSFVGVDSAGYLTPFPRAKADGIVSHDNSNGWPGWTAATGLSTVDSAVVGTNQDGRVEAWATGSDGKVQHMFQQPGNPSVWSPWVTLPGTQITVAGRPSLARRADGGLEGFAVSAADGKVQHNSQTTPNGTWSGWVTMTQSPVAGGAPIVGANSNGTLEAFVVATDGAVSHSWQSGPNGTWGPFYSLGGSLTGQLTVVTNGDGRLEVVGRWNDGSVRHIWQTAPSSGWTSWYTLNGSTPGNPFVQINQDGRLQVFVVGTDSKLYNSWQTSPGGGWSAWASLTTATVSGDPVVQSNRLGGLEIFWAGTDSKLYHMWQNGSNGPWQGPFDLSEAGAQPWAADVDASPTSVVASQSSTTGAATVAWQAPVYQTAVSGYRITPYISGVAQTVSTSSGSPSIVTGLQCDATYQFTVTPQYTIGTGPASAKSGPVVVGCAPGQPGTPTATLGSNQHVTVSWSPSGGSVTDYVITPFVNGQAQATFDAGTALTLDISDLVCGNVYTFTVTAKDQQVSGIASGSSQSPVRPNCAPAAPTNVAATAGQYSAVIKWTQPATAGFGIAYTVTPFIGGVAQAATSVGGGTSATLGGLRAGAVYTFAVSAQNAAGLSAATSSAPLQVAGPTSGLAGSLLLSDPGCSSTGCPGAVYWEGAWISKYQVPPSAKWTVDGYVSNMTQGRGATGAGMSWGILNGPPSDPGSAVAGLQWWAGDITNGSGLFWYWPGGRSTQGLDPALFAGSTPVHVALESDGQFVYGFINGTEVLQPTPITGANPGQWSASQGAAGFMDWGWLNHASFDEFRVASDILYPPNSTFSPSQHIIATSTDSTQILFHFDDYDTAGRLPALTVTQSNQNWVTDPNLFGDSSQKGTGRDADVKAKYVCGFACATDHNTYQPYSMTQTVSASALLGGGSPWICPCTRSTKRPVNTSSGEFWHTFDDLAIPGRGLPIDLQRTYSSAVATSTPPGPFGYGWSHSYQTRLQVGPGSPPSYVSAVAGNGSTTTFQFGGAHAGGGTDYRAVAVQASVYQATDGTFTLTDNAKVIDTFDAVGNLVSEADRNGYITALGYTSGKLSSVTAPGGISISFTYDTSYPTLVHSLTDSAGRTFIYGYDTNSNLISVTDAGHQTGPSTIQAGIATFAYDASHRMTTMRDPNCTPTTAACAYTPGSDGGLGIVHGTTNVYDVYNRVIRQYDDRGVLTEFAYTPDGDPFVPTNTTTVTEHPTASTSAQTVDTYRGGLLTNQTRAAGTSQAATWRYSYDPTSLGLISSIDPAGRATIFTRDAHANPLTVTDPMGGIQTKTFTTDGFNNLLTDQDPLQFGGPLKTTYTYDGQGNLIQVSRPLDSPVGTLNIYYNRTDLTHLDDVKTRTDGDGKIWKYSYDALKGYLVSMTDPVGAAETTHYGYDLAGRLSCEVVAKGNTSCPNTPIGTFETQYKYDPSGGSVDTLTPLGHHATALFDLNENRVSTTDANGNRTDYIYDGVDRLIKTTYADAAYDTTAFDDLSNITSETTATATATFFRYDYSYDLLNHLVTSTDNASTRHQTTFTHDPRGEVTALRDPQGQVTTSSYDAGGRLTSVAFSDNVTPSATYTYDADGQRLSMADGTGTSSYHWDSLHRLTLATNGAGAAVGYAYNFRGEATAITYPGATGTVQRTFDAAGRLKSAKDWLGTSAIQFAYDVDGNLKTSTFPNGVVATSTYDNADQLQQIADTGSAALFNFSYTGTPRDAMGQLKADGSQTFGYDNRNRLSILGGVNGSWTYDAANNMTKSPTASTLTYDGANQLQTMLTAAGTTSFNFDTRGNRIGQTPPGGPSTTYGYDQANRLTSYGAVSSYAYNGDGLRMSKAVTSPSAMTTQFSYDMIWTLPTILQAVATSTGSPTVTSYITGPGGLPVEQIAPGGVVSYFHQDQLGSTAKMTAAAGAVVGAYAYSPFGTISVITGTPPPFGFAGQYTDNETGLIYLRARYYDPATDQFISRDPLVGQTREPYAYVGDNPLNYTDPSGNFAMVLIPIAIGVVIVAAAAYEWMDAQNHHGAVSRVAFDPLEGTSLQNVQNNVGLLASDAQAAAKTCGDLWNWAGAQIGGSGKPRYHNKDYPTRGRAKEAARNAGQGNPMEHPNPTQGDPHFHPVDDSGDKIPGTHYNYPP